ncbi:unnamed protein product [Heligmosomoides polygyrus]|uniref:Phlebovirus_G2 domain-containing protein n=1 Tax=Heligmosomoides polygyrus TaxID=6339 RepID=A0A183F7E2_HELPZ|nr:unnamed protein product [Heligmosomoides polygyrus]
MIVPELHAQSADILSHDDFYCVDINGNIITSPSDRSSITGTTAFCGHHTCSPTKTANLFCAYPTPVTTYQHGNVSIVIKAWGTTVRTYYPNMMSPSHATDSYSIPRCTVGGILIETTDTFDMVEACSSFIAPTFPTTPPVRKFYFPRLSSCSSTP